MADVNPDVKAQMDRIHKATNDGTFDKETINDALARMWDFLTGAAYEHGTAGAEASGRAEPEGDTAESEGGEDEHPHKRARKKR